MMNNIIEAIQNAKNIVITSHRSPDGDSIGSSLGLYQFIKSMGKEAVICHPDPAPNFLLWVDDVDKIINAEEHIGQVEELVSKADLIFALDYNGLGRLGEPMQDIVGNASAMKIMIDHHLYPEDFAQITYSDSTICSTSQMVYELIVSSQYSTNVNAKIGTPLYLGILTDTGSFRFPSVTPRTHRIVAELIEAGVIHHEIHEKVFDQNTMNKLKLRGYATSEKLNVIHNGKVAYISLTEEELSRFEYEKGDTEGLVNVALSIVGVQSAALFTESNGKIKISFRAKGTYEVNKLANDHFSGGGHKYASGGISYTSMEETIEKYKSVLNDYFK